MALNSLQITVLRLLAERRKRSGESYVAGGVALNFALQAPRISRDVNLFHDTDTALAASVSGDRNTLQQAGLVVEVRRESRAFVGYLIWAACGKDEGYGPGLMLDGASRQRYSQTELDLLDFDGARPSAATLGRAFKEAIAEARVILDTLPEEEIGCCLLKQDGSPYSELPDRLVEDLTLGGVIRFHKGSIGGVWPVIVE